MVRPRRPVIGVTASRNGTWLLTQFNRLAVWRAGGIPKVLQPARHGQPPLDGIEGLDGLVIGGGDDISADLYDGEVHWQVRISPARDRLERSLLDHALGRGVPVLGICRGAQMINVHLGGSLHGHIHDVYDGVPKRSTPLPMRTITVVAGSRLEAILRRHKAKVNTLHHQSVDKLGRGLHITALDRYGIVQAVEDPDHRFLIGVQWHPELMLFHPSQQRLFKRLVEVAGEK